MRLLIAILVLIVAVVGGGVLSAMRPEIAAIEPPARSTFTAELIAQGEALAGVGDCAVCHTKPGGAAYAGGFKLPTPFGAIYSTNITPDPETGIGRWSEAAFRRAMREGVDREGDYLYPAFPYDHFTKTTDEDLHALYAFLMTRRAAKAPETANELSFPFNVRLLMAGWNALFLTPGPYKPDPAKSAAWNRGAYLVEGLGHCGACHTPRNPFGAEDAARHYAGGEAEGWLSPALNANSPSPVVWTVEALTNYLIDGWDEHHGIAAGPMTPVVNQLSKLPEAEVTAIATYVASLSGRTQTPADRADAVTRAKQREFASQSAPPAMQPDTPLGRGEATFAKSCANCHRQGGQTVPLALTGTVVAPDPRNAIGVILDGIKPTAGAPDRTMPKFGAALSDEQIGELVAFMRARFTSLPAWSDVPKYVKESRAAAAP